MVFSAIPQVITEDRASAAHIVDGSLAINNDRSQYLRKAFSGLGNTRTFTWSSWVRRFSFGDWQRIFTCEPGANLIGGLSFTGTASGSSPINAIRIQQQDTDGNNNHFHTNAAYRDTGWYHIVMRVDTTSGTPGDRLRLYVNGELQSGTYQQGAAPGQNSRFYFNRTNNYHEIGHSTQYNAYYDGRMTQCYWIDGQSLGPENFGFSDPLTNTWRPKKYEQLGPNNGTTWSSGTTAGSIEAARPWALGFDGREDTFTRPTSNQMASIMFDTPINFTSKFEIKGARDSGNTGSIEVYDGTDAWIDVSSSFGTYSQSYDYPRVDITSSITSPVKGIRFNGVSAVYQPRFTGIYVDDQILIDGDTSNMGRNGFYLPMDGNTPIGKDQSGRGNDWTPVNFGGSNSLEKATGAIPILNTNGGGTATISGVRTDKKTYTVTASGGKYYLDGVLTPTLNFLRGGTYIFDYTGATSHPFKFSTTSDGTHGGGSEYTDGTNTATTNVMKITVPHNAPDTLYYYCSAHSGMGSSINVTTDVLKADPYAWKCMFAMASDTVDHSPEINVNSTASIFGDIHTTTPQGLRNLYGHSKKMETGGGFRIDMELTTTAANAKHQWGTGDFTVECWHYQDGAQTSWQSLMRSASYNNSGLGSVGISHYAHGTGLRPYWGGNSSAGNFGTISNVVPYKKWNHTAWTRQGGVSRIFANGILVSTFTDNKSYDNKGFEIGDVYTWNGGYQDARIYNGVAKYTENFVVPATSPDFLPDTPSGITGKTNLAKITDGAVSFAGTTDYLYTSDSTDLELGSGDFTIEAYINPTGTPGNSGYNCIFAKGESLQCYFMSTGSLTLFASTNYSSNSYDIINGNGLSAGSLLLNRWHHLAVCRSGNTWKVFLDGIEGYSGTHSGSIEDNAYGFSIGDYAPAAGSYEFEGFISNFRVIKGTALYTSNFTPPTAPLTNVTNTKLLCCQSNTSATAAAVAPNLNTYTVRDINGGTYWSGATLSDGSNLSNLFDGDNSTSCQQSTNGTAASITNFGPVNVSSTVSFYSPDGNARYTLNGGSEVSVSGTGWHDISFSGTLTSFTFQAPGSARIFIFGMKIDGVELVDIIAANGDAAATNFNPFTDDINAIRGQETGYCTLNPLHNDLVMNRPTSTLSDGNLTASAASAANTEVGGTIGVSSGKWYFELINILGGNNTDGVGIADLETGTEVIYRDNGQFRYNGSTSSYGVSWQTSGDVVGVKIDLDNSTIGYFVNGIYRGDAKTNLPSATYHPFVYNRAGAPAASELRLNFGQEPFKFPPPDGFQPLNLSNVQPEKVIARPDQYVSAITYSGNNLSSNTVSDLKFNSKPDFVWIKSRSGSSSPGSQNHYLMDSVRGANGASGTSKLYSNNNGAANSGQTATTNGVRFTHNGFELTTNNDGTNSNNNYVAWCWKAGGSEGTFNVDGATYATAAAAGLSAGTMTVTGASVGTKQGFSIVRYTGSGSAGSLAHGLGQKPTFWIVKAIDAATYPNWYAYTEQLDGSLDFMHFHTNEHKFDSAAAAPTSTTIGITSTLGEAVSWITYMWHDVPGLQKFGSFIGNSSQNFVELGFRPAIVWVKRAIANSSSDTSTNNSAWTIMDSTRLSYNGQTPNHLYANHTADEGKRGDGSGTSSLADMTLEPHSNGFYLNGPATETNSNTGQFIYCAWAEAPSINLYGAQANAR